MPTRQQPDPLMMNQAPHQTPFPFSPALAWLSGSAAVLLLAGVTVAIRQFPGDTGVLRSVIASIVMVWLTSIASLVLVRAVAGRGAQAVAMTHFAGAGGRALLCLLLGLFGVYGLGLAMQPVMFTIAAAYLPLVVVESVFVANFVRASYDMSLGVQP